MMNWEESGASSGSDEEVDDIRKAVSKLHDKGSASSSSSIRGLQMVLEEGWIIQRARDMCSFAHDRYRQAAQAEADSLPQEVMAKMSLRIILMMLHEIPIDVYRIAEHAKRSVHFCISECPIKARL